MRHRAAVAGLRSQAKFTAAHASVLARFDAADAHDSDGYGTSAAWLMAMTDMTRRDARAEVRRMRLLRGHPAMAAALAAADISKSQALAIADWTKKLPGRAARGDDQDPGAGRPGRARRWMTCGSSPASRWRSGAPRGRTPTRTGSTTGTCRPRTTFGGAGVIRGNLTPECAAAVQAVLEALGKKAGAEDTRTEGQRFHDALQQGCELLIGAKMVPDRAGADTHVAVHIPFPELRQRPGAPEAEEVWLRGAAGEPGYLTGKDAEAAACDAVAEPVVTGHADMRVVDKIIALALAAAGLTLDGADPGPAGDDDDDGRRDPDGRTATTVTSSWGTAGGGRARAASRARSRARERFTPDADAGAAVRHRPARHRLRLRPGRPRRLAAHHPARTAVQHAVAAAGHRLLRLHPGQHPPRRPAPRPRLRLAPAADGPPPGATCTTCSTRKTAAKPP